MNTLKKCPRCTAFLPRTDFHRLKSRYDGLQAVCKSCQKKQHRQYNAAHRDKMRAYYRTYYYAHLDAEREKALRWRNKNLQKAQHSARLYRKLHPHEIRASAKLYKANNQERVKKWYRDWIAANPDVVRQYSRSRKALLRSGESGTHVNLKAWNEILRLYQHRCAYCGRHDKKLTQDHYFPLSKGGKHLKENIVPACSSCNSRKNNRSPLRLF